MNVFYLHRENSVHTSFQNEKNNQKHPGTGMQSTFTLISQNRTFFHMTMFYQPLAQHPLQLHNFL